MANSILEKMGNLKEKQEDQNTFASRFFNQTEVTPTSVENIYQQTLADAKKENAPGYSPEFKKRLDDISKFKPKEEEFKLPEITPAEQIKEAQAFDLQQKLAQIPIQSPVEPKKPAMIGLDKGAEEKKQIEDFKGTDPIVSSNFRLMTEQTKNDFLENLKQRELEKYAKAYKIPVEQVKKLNKQNVENFLTNASNHPIPSLGEQIMSPFNKALEKASENPNNWSMLEGVKGFVSGVGDVISHKTPQNPITAKTAEERKLIERHPSIPGLYRLDLNKLAMTYADRDESINENLMSILGTKRTPITDAEIKNLRDLIAIKSVLAEKNPDVKRKAKDILDTIAFGIPSAIEFQEKLAANPILKRNPAVTVITDPNDVSAIFSKITEAQQTGKPTEWNKIIIDKNTNFAQVEDAYYAQKMMDRVGALATQYQLGVTKDIGYVVQNALFSYFAGLGAKGMGKVAQKAAPEAYKLFAQLAKTKPVYGTIVEKAAATAIDAPIQSKLTEYGTVGSEETKKRAGEMAAIGAAVTHTATGAAGLVAKDIKAKVQNSPVKQTVLQEMRKESAGVPSAYINAINNATSFQEIPEPFKVTIRAEDFPVIKEWVTGRNSAVKDLVSSVDNVKENTGVNMRTWEGFKQALANPNDPVVSNMLRNLETANYLTNLQTLEETRVHTALVQTLNDATKRSKEAPVLSPLHVELPKKVDSIQEIVGKYEHLFNTPENLIKALRKDRPEIAQSFEQRLKSGPFQKPEFTFYKMQEFLNTVPDLNKDNIHRANEALGTKNSFLANIKAAYGTSISNKSPIEVVRNAQGNLNLHLKKLDNVKFPIIRDLLTVADKMKENRSKKFAPLLSIVKDIKNDKPVTKTYKSYINKLISIYPEAESILTALDKYNKALDDKGGAELTLADSISAMDNLNPTRVLNRKVEVLSNDRDRVMYGATTSQNPEKFLTQSLFKVKKDGTVLGVDGAPIYQPVKEILTGFANNHLPGRNDISHLMTRLDDILHDETVSPEHKKDAGRLRKYLKSYHEDIKSYNKAIDAIHNPMHSVVETLTISRRNLDQIKNPVFAREIHDQIQYLKPKFFQMLDDIGVNHSVAEMNSMWNYLTGDAFVKFKEGVYNYDLLNETTLDSMLKAHNALTKNTIDSYAAIFQDQYGYPLDRVAFHSFFCTPINGFDSNGMFASSMFMNALKEKRSVMDYANDNFAKTMNLIKSFDMMEVEITKRTRLATGADFSNFINDIREAKALGDGILNGEVELPGIEKVQFYEKIRSLNCYKALEHPTLQKMIKKSFVLEGYESGMNIHTFNKDGSYSLTDYGRFLDSVFSNPKTMELLASENMTFENRVEFLRDKLLKFGMLKPEELERAEVMANYTATYWDFFDTDNVPEMWAHTKEFNSFFAYLDSYLMRVDKAITDKKNFEQKQINGPQAIYKLYRAHRNNNMKVSDNNLFSHPYLNDFTDQRVTSMFGTSENAVALNAKEFTLENTKNPLDLLYSKIWQSTMQAATYHSRSKLEAYAVGAQHFGFGAQAEWIATNSGLTNDLELQIENIVLAKQLQRFRGLDNKYLSTIVPIAADTLSSSVQQFGSVFSPLNVVLNHAQASTWSVTTSNRSFSKIVSAMTSLSKMGWMPLFYNKNAEIRKGLLGQVFKKMVVTDPVMWDISEQIVKRYEDTQFRQRNLNAIEYSRVGKTYEVPFSTSTSPEDVAFNLSAKYARANDVISKGIAENLKERSELYNVRWLANEGTTVAQKVIENLVKNDQEKAFALLSACFRGSPETTAQWHFDNFRRHLEAKSPETALYGFLPAYIDQNTGRFGTWTTPQYIKMMNKMVNGTSVFYSASNMWAWKVIQTASNATDKITLERARSAAALVSIITASSMMGAYYKFLTKGVPTPIADQILSDEQKQKLFNGGDSATTKMLVHGLFPFLDLSKATGMKTPVDYFKLDYGEGGKGVSLAFDEKSLNNIMAESFGMLGFSPTGNRMQNALLGQTVAAGWRAGKELWATMQYESSANEALYSTNTAAMEDHLEAQIGDQELLQKWTEDQTNPQLIDMLEKRYAVRAQTTLPKVLNSILKVSKFNFVADILSNPISSTFLFYEFKNYLSQINPEVTNKSTAETIAAIGNSFNSQPLKTNKPEEMFARPEPFTQMQRTSVMPVHKIWTELFKLTGWADSIKGETEKEQYVSFLVNGIGAFMVKNKIISPEFVNRMVEANVKQADVINGWSKMKKELPQPKRLPIDTQQRAIEEWIRPK